MPDSGLERITDGTNVVSVTSSGQINVSTQNTTAATASFDKITDGTNVAAVVSASNLNGPELSISNGSTIPATTLNAITTATATGSVVDAGAAQSNWSAVAVAGAGITAGTLTIMLSVDGTNFASSTATVSTAAAGNYLVASTGRPARYGRVDFSGGTGTINITAKMMAAG